MKRLIRLLLLVALFPVIAASSSFSTQQSPSGNLQLVIEVIDGDTAKLSTGELVRYLGIDAPETHHPNGGKECFGPEATQRNRELVEGRYVLLECDITNQDSYGRLLRYVYVDDVFINGVLVEEGFAYSNYFPPDIAHYQLLLSLELVAEEVGAGLWSECAK